MNTIPVINNKDSTVITQFHERFSTEFIKWAYNTYSCPKTLAKSTFDATFNTYLLEEAASLTDTYFIENSEAIQQHLHKISNRKLIIQIVKKGDERILSYLYKVHRNKFLYRAKQRFAVPIEEAEDVFQETIIAFHNNILSGKLNKLTVDVEWYLCKIFDNKLLNQKTKQKNQEKLLDNIYQNNQEQQAFNTYEKNMEKEQFVEAIQLIMRELDDSCKEVLRLYYFKQYSMEAIADELNYGNARVATTKKSKCLRKLAGKAELIRKLKKLR